MNFSEEDFEEFKVEAMELLDNAEASLLDLDKGCDFKICFDKIFRSFHNLKGSAGMMDLEDVQTHAHELENVLMEFKNADNIPKDYVNFFFKGMDATRALLNGEKVSFDFKIEGKNSSIDEELKNSNGSQIGDNCGGLAQELPEGVVDEFIVDCEEMLERISLNVELLENKFYDPSAIDSLYRDVHTLKGNSFLFSYSSLGRLAHQMETSLEGIREQTHLASDEFVNLLFKGIGVIESILKFIRVKGTDSSFSNVVDLLVKALELSSNRLEKIEREENEKEESANNELIQAVENVPEVIMPEETIEGQKKIANAGSIRVPVALLDNLMTLVGEMVLVRNQVLQYSTITENLDFLKMSKRLNVVTTEIQEEMMKTRMQPIGNLLQKFSRVIRDLSVELEKNIKLNLIGAETELDKTLLEAIKDPLTHIVRNSCDHGIETPETRAENGKNETGIITIKAYHEGGQVIIEVSDDGKGLDKKGILDKALEKNIVLSTDAEKLSDKDIFNLIFSPGFSTAQKVTNVSGRGVGMDVVRTNIESIGGTVDLSGEAGVGTTIKIKIPLTLAIVPALIVNCKDATFAIPQVKLEELVRVGPGDNDNKIEILHGVPVCRLRGNIVSLVDLNNMLKMDEKERVMYDDKVLNIAILNADHCRFGVIVDQVQDTADIVVKPLNKLLKSLKVYSGATILGDGSIALIFDVLGISKIAQISQSAINTQEIVNIEELQSEEKDFLLFNLKTSTKHAIALSYVERLEEFKISDIEYSGGDKVIRYGDIILPLLSASEQLGFGTFHAEEKDEGTFNVVVIEKAGRQYGIIIEKILDTLSTSFDLDLPLQENNMIFGNLNSNDELIVVLNPFELIDSKYPMLVEGVGSLIKDRLEDKVTVLLVEDTPFFRKSMETILVNKGYEVILANNGEVALNYLNQKNSNINLIVSDIEMPIMDGFEMAKRIRNNASFKSLPMIAISSKADAKHIEKGRECGFDVYLEKLKPQELLSKIDELSNSQSNVA